MWYRKVLIKLVLKSLRSEARKVHLANSKFPKADRNEKTALAARLMYQYLTLSKLFKS